MNRPTELLLSRLHEVRQAGADSWMALCPAHPDEKTPSLSIKSAGDRCLVYCHGKQCSAASIAWAVGLKIGDLFEGDPPRRAGAGNGGKRGFEPVPEGEYALRVARVREEEKDGKKRLQVQFRVLLGPHRGECVFESFDLADRRALVRLKRLWTAIGLEARGTSTLSNALMEGRTARVRVTVFDGGKGKRYNRVEWKSYAPCGEICYDYRDEHGVLLYQVVRFGAPAWPGTKEFLQRRPNGSGGWTWSLKDVRRVLYRLPELLAADPAAVVFFVEGERDAESLRALGQVATTTSQGASSLQKTKAEEFKVFAGRQVVILPDNDEAGERYAVAAARTVAQAGGSVKSIRLAGLAAGGDVSDWIAAGGTADRLLELALGEGEPAGGDADGDPVQDPVPDAGAFVVANYEEEEVDTEKGTQKIRTAIPLRSIVAAVSFATGGWPKHVGGELFANRDGEIWILDDQSTLFAFLFELATVRWKTGADSSGANFVGREELFKALRVNSRGVEEISTVPIYPLPPGVEVVSRFASAPKATGAVDRFVGLFDPATEVDRMFIRSMILTFFWGGPPGQRPAFVITGPEGVGIQATGKTKLVELLSSLVGGAIRVSLEERGDSVAKQVLSDSALGRRVVLLDNLSGFTEHRELAELLTAEQIEGRPAFGQQRRRTNRLTWCMTAVSPELDDDLASRSVVIHLARPDFDAKPLWEREVARHISEHREEIIQDALAILSGPRASIIARHSRTPSWDLEVLATSPTVDEALLGIKTRQQAVNARSEVIDIVIAFIHEVAMKKINQSGSAEFSTRDLSWAWQESTGQKVNVIWVSRRLREAHRLGKLPDWLPPPSDRRKKWVVNAELILRDPNLRQGGKWTIDMSEFWRGSDTPEREPGSDDF